MRLDQSVTDPPGSDRSFTRGVAPGYYGTPLRGPSSAQSPAFIARQSI